MRYFLLFIGILIVVLGAVLLKYGKKINFNTDYEIGEAIDSLNGVVVYFNGAVDHISERKVVDGYNVGLQYQCVEFVKRYYFEQYKHRMPDSYGHAKSFYNPQLDDGALNVQRNLLQFANPSKAKPAIGDLIVMKATAFNRFGHVCIVSEVADSQIQIIQQNPGPRGPSRKWYPLSKTPDGLWEVEEPRTKGWLRMPSD